MFIYSLIWGSESVAFSLESHSDGVVDDAVIDTCLLNDISIFGNEYCKSEHTSRCGCIITQLCDQYGNRKKLFKYLLHKYQFPDAHDPPSATITYFLTNAMELLANDFSLTFLL